MKCANPVTIGAMLVVVAVTVIRVPLKAEIGELGLASMETIVGGAADMKCADDWGCHASDSCVAGNLCLDCSEHNEEEEDFFGWKCEAQTGANCTLAAPSVCLTQYLCERINNSCYPDYDVTMGTNLSSLVCDGTGGGGARYPGPIDP